jgi:predicted RNA-binding protein
MQEINAVIEWPNGDYVQFEDYYEGLKAYDQITDNPNFTGSLKFIDLRSP